jgi:hypothetical protein
LKHVEFRDALKMINNVVAAYRKLVLNVLRHERQCNVAEAVGRKSCVREPQMGSIIGPKKFSQAELHLAGVTQDVTFETHGTPSTLVTFTLRTAVAAWRGRERRAIVPDNTRLPRP